MFDVVLCVWVFEFFLCDVLCVFLMFGDLNVCGYDGFENVCVVFVYVCFCVDIWCGSCNILWDIYVCECGDCGVVCGDILECRRAAGDVFGGRRGVYVGDVFDDGDGGYVSECDC